MNTTEHWADLARDWRLHCESVRWSSNLKDYLDCAAYRDLVAAGRAIVPWVMARMEEGGALPWEFVLREVTDFQAIEDPTSIDFAEANRRRRTWWQTHRHLYPMP